MARHIYLVAGAENEVDGIVYRGPRYFEGHHLQPDPALSGTPMAAMDYGLEPFFLVVSDTTPEQHALLSGLFDVFAIPDAIESSVAGSVAPLAAYLEGVNIPADWIHDSLSWRQILRAIGGLFQAMQRLHYAHPARLFAEATLDTECGDLSEDARAAVEDHFGWSQENPGTAALRTILNDFIAHATEPFHIGGISI